MFLLIIGVVVLAAAVGGLAYAASKSPPKALLAMTAAGALVIIPYSVQSDPDMDLVMDPTTGKLETVINGINTSSGALHVDGGSTSFNTTTGAVGLKLVDGDPERYLAGSKVDRTQERLAEAGVETDKVRLEEPPRGFRRWATGLVVRPRPGETPEQTLARVRATLGEEEIETREGSAESFGITGVLSDKTR